MIVLDASAAVDYLLELEPQAGWVRVRLEASGTVSAPHLIDAEVASAVRGLGLGGRLPSHGALGTLRALAELAMVRFPVYPLLERVWDLRHNLTAYDAAYIALAEALDAPLLTTDSALARSTGHRARIEAYPGS